MGTGDTGNSFAPGLPIDDNSNGVFRCQDPMTGAPVWFIGDQGIAQNQIDHVHIVNNGGTYQLFFPYGPASGYPNLGQNGFGPSGAPVNATLLGYPAPPGAPFLAWNAGPGAISAALNTMLTSAFPGAGIKGASLFISNYTSTPASVDFDINFGGTLSLTPLPLFNYITSSGLPDLSVTIAQLGGGADTRSAQEFPAGDLVFGHSNFYTWIGNIKFGTVLPAGAWRLDQIVLYASTARPVNPIDYANYNQQFDVEKSTTGSYQWFPVTNPSPSAAGTAPASLGNYDMTLLVDQGNQNHVVLAELGQPLGTGPWETIDGGTTWTDIGVALNAPHTSYHAAAFTQNGSIVFGTDGGVFEDVKTPGQPLAPGIWSDLNGDLAISEFNSVAAHPSDLNIALGGTTNNGIVNFSGGQAWITSTPVGNGGTVIFNPKNPKIAYEVVDTVTQEANLNWADAQPLGAVAFNFLAGFWYANSVAIHSSTLHESTDGGNTWGPALTLLGSTSFANGTPFSAANFPVVVDDVNPARLLVGGGFSNGQAGIPPGGIDEGNGRITNALFNAGPTNVTAIQESLDGGVTWTNLTKNMTGLISNGLHITTSSPPSEVFYEITGIGLPSYQGVFQPDPSFTQVLDKGADTYDPDTIYAVVNDFSTQPTTPGSPVGQKQYVLLTKNHAQSWVDRSPVLPAGTRSRISRWTPVTATKCTSSSRGSQEGAATSSGASTPARRGST